MNQVLDAIPHQDIGTVPLMPRNDHGDANGRIWPYPFSSVMVDNAHERFAVLDHLHPFALVLAQVGALVAGQIRERLQVKQPLGGLPALDRADEFRYLAPVSITCESEVNFRTLDEFTKGDLAAVLALMPMDVDAMIVDVVATAVAPDALYVECCEPQRPALSLHLFDGA